MEAAIKPHHSLKNALHFLGPRNHISVDMVGVAASLKFFMISLSPHITQRHIFTQSRKDALFFHQPAHSANAGKKDRRK